MTDYKYRKVFKNIVKFISVILILKVIRTTSANNIIAEYCEMETTVDDFDYYLESYISDNPKLALLLDYDGTLAPIAPNPKNTLMRQETQDILKRLSNNGNIFMAIISGRAVDDVRQRVGISQIVYAGNHGLEISYPNGTSHDYQIPKDVSDNYLNLLGELEGMVERNPNGAWVEDKIVSLTFHYRQVEPELHEKIRADAEKIIKKYGFRANPAHYAIEAKPPVEWNKGSAAEFVLKDSFGDSWRENQKIIFAGDDTSDEDVMKTLKGSGVSFRVSNDPNIQTNADYRIPCSYSVTSLLKWIEKRYMN